jgi:hypothetical protein
VTTSHHHIIVVGRAMQVGVTADRLAVALASRRGEGDA